MKTRYVCREHWKEGCNYEIEDEQPEIVRRGAEEHLKAEHPEEALESDKAQALLDGFWKPA